MCIIAFKPKDVELPSNFYDKVKVMIGRNRDGCGMAIKRSDNNTIHIIKGMYSADDMIRIIKNSHPNKQDEFLFHARIGTSGNNDKFNCHPFYINNNLKEVILPDAYRKYPVVAHNGIFSDYSRGRIEPYSDTVHFVIQFLAIHRYLKILEGSPELFEKLFSKEIDNNKLVIMFPEANRPAYIINKSLFNEYEGIFYSNTGHYLTTEKIASSSKDREIDFHNVVNSITNSRFIKRGSCTYTINKHNVMKTVGTLSVVGGSLREGFIQLDPKNSNRFIFGEKHPLYNYKRGENKEIHIISDTKEVFRIVNAYKTGLHLINIKDQTLKWINPVEMLINYTMKNVE